MVSPKQFTIVALAIPLVIAAVLLFSNLGRFGMWEPHETDRVAVAGALANGAQLPADTMPGTYLEERLAGLGWSIGGKSELAARTPLAVLALITVAAVFLLLSPLAGSRIAWFAALVIASSPVLLFHGRQLTSGMPLLFGETLAVGGLALAAFGPSKQTALFGAIAALGGLVLGWLAGGLLIGVAAPAGTIAVTLMLSGDASGIFKPAEEPVSRPKQLVFFIVAPLAILAASAYFAVTHFIESDLVLVTGGLSTSSLKPKSFEFCLEQLAYGWFPWSALAPVAILGFFRKENDDNLRPLRALCVAGLSVGLLSQSFFVSLHGVGPCFIAIPMIVAVAIAIADMERSVEPERLGAVIAVALLVIMIRDFAQRPETILMGYGFEKIPIPKEFAPIIPAAICAAPTGLVALFLGFVGSGGEKAPKWRSWRAIVSVPIAAAWFGAYLSFMLVPDLAVHLSSKYVMESYKSFQQGGEPLGVYGPSQFVGDGTKLGSQREVMEWLRKSERAFVLFPPKNLADFNRRFRKEAGRHIFVLDATSDRFILATSQPKSGEKNKNPVAPFVQSKPFAPAPSNTFEVNFDDKVTFLGWSVATKGGGSYLAQGKDATITTYWRADGNMKSDYKVFMHIDGPGGRLHGDHEPVQGKYPTRKWEKGDYVKDVFELKVPLYQKAGAYQVRLGMYKGSKRLKILDDSRARENSLRVGEIQLR